MKVLTQLHIYDATSKAAGSPRHSRPETWYHGFFWGAIVATLVIAAVALVPT